MHNCTSFGCIRLCACCWVRGVVLACRIWLLLEMRTLFSKGRVNSWSPHSVCLLFSIFPGLEVGILKYLLWKDYKWYPSLCCLFGWFCFLGFFNLHRFFCVLSAPISLNSPDQDHLRPPPLPWASRSLLSSNWDPHSWCELEEQSRGVTAAVWPSSVKVRLQVWVLVGVGSLNSSSSSSGAQLHLG